MCGREKGHMVDQDSSRPAAARNWGRLPVPPPACIRVHLMKAPTPPPARRLCQYSALSFGPCSGMIHDAPGTRCGSEAAATQ